MSSGFVGILSFDVRFAGSGSLKAKRSDVLSLKASLQRRCSASVAEVDHHDVWQRTRLMLAVVDRHERGAAERLDQAERLVLGAGYEAGPFERRLLSSQDLEP